MKKKRTLFIIAVLAIAASAFYGGQAYFRPNTDIIYLKPAFTIQTSSLLQEFKSDDATASRKYLGKVVATEGIILSIEKGEPEYFTVVLGDQNLSSSVRCSIDAKHLSDLSFLKKGSWVGIKGVFTGYNKDETGLLGSDIQLNRCMVFDKK